MKIVVNEDNLTPSYESLGAAGLDLKVSKETVIPQTGVRVLVPTGVKVAIPTGMVGLLVARSSLSKRGLFLTNGIGIIDSDYRGEIFVSLAMNPAMVKDGISDVILDKYERIAQLVIVPYYKASLEIVSSLDETARGTGGFGSTGNK